MLEKNHFLLNGIKEFVLFIFLQTIFNPYLKHRDYVL